MNLLQKQKNKPKEKVDALVEDMCAPHSRSRAASFWLTFYALLILIIVAGILLGRQSIESYRSRIANMIRQKLGSHFSFDSVTFSITQGIRLEKSSLDVQLTEPNAHIIATAPVAYVQLSIPDLFRKKFTVARVLLESPEIHIDGMGQSLGKFILKENRRTGLGLTLLPSDFVVKNGNLELTNIANLPSTKLKAIEARIDRDLNSGKIQTFLETILDLPDAPKASLELSYGSEEGVLSSKLTVGELSSNALATFHSAVSQYISAGQFSVTLKTFRETADAPVSLFLDSEFRNLSLDHVNLFKEPIDGDLSATASIVANDKRLLVRDATLNSNGFSGTLKGEFALDEDGIPVVNLMGEIYGMMCEEALQFYLRKYSENYGILEMNFSELPPVRMQLLGKLQKPEIVIELNDVNGTISFSPLSNDLPKVAAELYVSKALWSSKNKKPYLRLSAENATVEYPKLKTKGDNLAFLLTLRDEKVIVTPFSGRANNSRMYGSIIYDLNNRQGTASIQTTINDIEKTFMADIIKNVSLAGSCTLDGSITFDSSRLKAKILADATQTETTYRWWFRKPAGIGVKAQIQTDWQYKKSCSVQGELSSIDTEGTFASDFTFEGGKYRIVSTTANFPKLDIATVGRCLRIPYEIRGGTVTEGAYTWVRDRASLKDDQALWQAEVSCRANEISFKAKDALLPIVISQATLKGNWSKTNEQSAHLQVSADSCSMPPFGSPWFAPIEIPAELVSKYKPEEWNFSYDLDCRTLTVLPWQGTEFKAKAYFSRTDAGFSSYSANIEKGSITGSYNKNRLDNTVQASAHWNAIPVTYLLKHLKLPEAVKGTITGEVKYTLDMDDPNTLQGKSDFEISPGQFSVDFLADEFGLKGPGDFTAGLPPTLDFEKLTAQTKFERDLVETPLIRVVSPGIDIQATGRFIMRGDMDYDITVSLTPENADRIPALKQYLNLEGHRLAAQNIELKFKLSGPAYRPTSELAEGPPVSVTLVTGGLEMVSEAVKVIDIPRKILLDLLRIGGGIFSPSKKQP